MLGSGVGAVVVGSSVGVGGGVDCVWVGFGWFGVVGRVDGGRLVAVRVGVELARDGGGAIGCNVTEGASTVAFGEGGRLGPSVTSADGAPESAGNGASVLSCKGESCGVGAALPQLTEAASGTASLPAVTLPRAEVADSGSTTNEAAPSLTTASRARETVKFKGAYAPLALAVSATRRPETSFSVPEGV